MTLDEMIADVRRDANMPAAQGSATQSDIAAWLNRAQKQLAQQIVKADVGYFIESANIDFAADTAEYDLPREFVGTKIKMAERLDASGNVLRSPLQHINLVDRERWTTQRSIELPEAGIAYWLRDRKIGFAPTPKSAQTAAARIYGVQFPHDMLWGTLATDPSADLTTTTFKLDSVALTAGRVHTETDYYKNARIRLITGSARGTERKITAFNAATKVATIDSAWVTATVSAAQYVVLSPVPEQYHEAMSSYAIVNVAAKRRDEALFKQHADLWRATFEKLVDTIEPRNFDRNEHVEPAIDEEW